MQNLRGLDLGTPSPPSPVPFFQEDGGYCTAAGAAAAATAVAGGDANDADRQAELAEARETLRLLQLQTLKFSTIVVIFQVGYLLLPTTPTTLFAVSTRKATVSVAC